MAAVAAAVAICGFDATESLEMVARCVVNRWALCDLMEPYGRETRLRRGEPAERMSNLGEPFLRHVLTRGRR